MYSIENKYKESVRYLEYFKDEDKIPFKFTAGQKQIFQIVANTYPKRVQIISCTQYGKSLTIALGILCSAVLGGKKWAIIAPSSRQSMIIMNYIIQHIFDNVIFFSQLEIDSSLEKLKRERTRNRLVFKGGGEIMVLSADSNNKKKAGEALMGFGAPNIAIDESSLIDDDIYAKIVRMVGGSKDNFLIEIGNPFKRNHFFETTKDTTYEHISIGYEQALREGRMTVDVIEKAKRLPFFDVLYECKFPQAEMVDDKGYYLLLTDDVIDEAIKRTVVPKGKMRIGVDVGRGGDSSVFVLRYNNYAKVLEKNKIKDLMQQVKRIEYYSKELGIPYNEFYIDDIGVGSGVTDRCFELDMDVNPIRVAGSAVDKERYKNIRAEIYWLAREWLLDGEKEKNVGLQSIKDFYELSKTRYKEDSASRLQIQDKGIIKKAVGHSPDVADALALTFARQETEPEVFIL